MKQIRAQRMKLFALQIAAGFTVLPVASHASDVQIVKMNYRLARKLLLRDGYLPVAVVHPSTLACGGSEDVCAKYPETGYCVGTGNRPCAFEWKNKKGIVFVVATVGEQIEDLEVVGFGVAIAADLAINNM